MDVDLRKYFDTIDHGQLRESLRRRVRDGVILRLIGKWLNAGVLEAGVVMTPETGTPQGGVVTVPTEWNPAPSNGGPSRNGCCRSRRARHANA